ncbi:MAG: hypothetical protein JXX28_09850 [Deltaproteobacteria bacterium]|nr:hypothetical protein [Deltaproteobacteria bacterium]
MLITLTLAALAAETFDGQTYWWGDPHSHTGASGDGASADVGPRACAGTCGSVGEIEALAREAGLDWLSISDHTNGLWTARAEDFDAVWAAILDLDGPQHIVTVPAIEVHFKIAGGNVLGHRNAMFFGPSADLRALTVADGQHHGDSVEVSDCAEVWEFMGGLERRFGSVLLVPHHPAVKLPMPVNWGCHDPVWEPAVEVYSEHGSALGDETGFDPPWSGLADHGTARFAMEQYGARLAFLAGTDWHDTHPGAVCALDSQYAAHPYGGGLTAVVLPEGVPLTRLAIREALLARSTLATSGIPAPVSVEYHGADGTLGGMGAELELQAGDTLTVDVRLPEPWAERVEEVALVIPGGERDLGLARGPGLWSITLGPEALPAWNYVRVRIDGASWYGEGGCVDGGEDQTEYVWTSPAWLTQAEAPLVDEDGDGVSPDEGDCDDADPARSPLELERCEGEVDEDCDGLVDARDPDCWGQALAPPPVEEAKGCASAPTAPVGFLLPLLLSRRRRRAGARR